jgi:hypothetical protein
MIVFVTRSFSDFGKTRTLAMSFTKRQAKDFMGLGTKNRQKQTADICKQHLREKYRDQAGLAEEFIVEIEGAPKDCDVTRWGQFTDIKDIKTEMLKRLEVHFETWL